MAEPTITFGCAESFGEIAKWNEQSSNSSVVSDRARTLTKDGDQAASTTYNERTEVTTSYEAGSTSGCSILPANIGALTNSLILTGIDVSTSATGFATLSLSGHNHTANPHTSSHALKSVAHGIATPVGFGAVDFLGGTAGLNADVESSTLSISCEHVDVEAHTGNHLVGENYDPKVTATTVWNGAPTTAAATGTWDKVSVVTETTNSGHLKTTVTGEKALSFH